MGVMETNEWLERDFHRPEKMLEKLAGEFGNRVKADEIYEHLQRHGMYSPNSITKKTWEDMVEQDIWNKVDKMFSVYKRLWGGPDIPVFIFPLVVSGRKQSIETKSGLAYKDKLFLFYNKGLPEKEMEALLIHEYHHVCRLHQFKKEEQDYTLLDAMIMEGLAEKTVGKYLGSAYMAKWTKLYSEETMQKHWDRYLKDKVHIKRTSNLHDALLLGQKGYPFMLGYCGGYYLVKKSETVSVKKSFIIDSEQFLKK